MTSAEIRHQFLAFFEAKGHKIVPSAPIVLKDDPTLMFSNSGMTQFKDSFLGYREPAAPRIADTQKCLRVSGKHNDLEEVGIDSYHHTMFEMLGNWSFGDYFKQEAIDWAWELLTKVYRLDPARLYVTVFEGDERENLPYDQEAASIWLHHITESHLIKGNKKDNFWEMGAQGPCGPCSEIHVDLRTDAERAAVSGRDLVNHDHPQVVEVWNIVFMQYNRLANGTLEELPAKHIDTGMGFERLCMALQGKTSNYDTDVFTPLINHLQAATGVEYRQSDSKQDVAIRVNADHIRAVAFAIADGQLPSNTGAGYVIRRILRRAVRYYYSFLNTREPLFYSLVPVLAEQLKAVFPELDAQKDFVAKVIQEEERAFLRTLGEGLRRIDALGNVPSIDGKTAFELYDTFGFPLDLTRLVAQEKGIEIDEAGFEAALANQRQQARADAAKSVGDWVVLRDTSAQFVGYDALEAEGNIIRYRAVETKKGNQYQIALDRTPFYPEGGGQVGDIGTMTVAGETIQVLDTKKENDLVIHFVDKLPTHLDGTVVAAVDAARRHRTENNHSATHLVHAALRQVLGTHVHQKGSLVNADALRFDFSHFQKMTDEEIATVEQIVNTKIRENIALEEARNLPLEEAREAGAMMLFGEKYGETVRMITFDATYSRELCGGCHVPATGKIGFFKIVAESSVAAGVRRIEAVTAEGYEAYIAKEITTLDTVRGLLKSPKDIVRSIETLQEEHHALQKTVEKYYALQAAQAKTALVGSIVKVATTANAEGFVNFVGSTVDIESPDALKTMLFELRAAHAPLVAAIGTIIGGKAQLAIAISDDLVAATKAHKEKAYNASAWVREAAKHIQGGGGGQPFFATAGGTNPEGLAAAIESVKAAI